MSNPQVENGYLQIANELYEALARIRIPGEARQVFDVIVRRTYGWGKKTDIISLSTFSKLTGLPRPNVVRAIKKLIIINIITVIKKDNTSSVSYGVQKHYEEWKVLSKKIPLLSKTIIGVIQSDNKVLSKAITAPIHSIGIGSKTIKENKEKKEHFLDYVLLTSTEHQKLIKRFGKSYTEDYIERLNNYIGRIGVKTADKKNKSHYHTILSWLRKDNITRPKWDE
ncbi:MAG TPA: hypothetical protein ENH41_01085 [Candidatus Omnitrophica bacterium]|nr:hypothetical protein [Candidatus Omnitrophota bacterium]